MAGQGVPKTGIRAIEAAQKQAQAIELRIAGFSIQQVGDQLYAGKKSSAQKAIETGIRKTIQEPADVFRLLELSRLDKMQVGLWPRAIKGDVQAIDRVLKIMDRRAKLLGLDAPIKVNLAVLIQQAGEQFGLEPDELAELATSVEAFMAASREIPA